MEIPLEVMKKYPPKSTYDDPSDHLRSSEEYVNGKRVIVTRYGRNDISAPINIPPMGGVVSYVSTLALSKMSR